jgi:hypothetical protein
MTAGALTRRHLLVGFGSSAALMTAVGHAQTSGERVLRYTFNQETHSWIPGLCDYSLDATGLRFTAEVRQLPPNFQSDLRAYYLQSHNTPDDLFMFVKKEISGSDGVEPNRTYGVSIHIGFLSNAYRIGRHRRVSRRECCTQGRCQPAGAGCDTRHGALVRSTESR